MKNYSIYFIFIFCILILLSSCGNSPEIIITGSENSEIQTTEESKSNEDTTEAHQINWIEDERYRQQPEEYHISSQLKEFLTEYFQQQKYETVENHEMIDLIENVPYQDEEWTIIRIIYGADRHILSVRKTESGYNIEADVSYRNDEISKDDWETLVSIMIRAIQEHEKTHPVTPELVDKVSEKLKEKMFLPPIGGMEDLHEYLTEEEAEEIKNKMKVLFGVEENEKEAAEYILWSNGYNSIHDTMLAVTISCDEVEPIQKEEMNNPVTLPDIKFIVYATQEGEIQDIIINHEAMSSQEIESKETISNTTDPIDTGEDQFYTGLRKVTLKDDMFSKGAALEDTYLYPCPTEKVYEIGEVYKGRTFDIIKKVESRDDQYEKEEWYLIQYNVEEESYLGYLKAEDVADAEKTEVEPGEPYLMRMSDYTENGSETEYIGPLFLEGRNEYTGKYKLVAKNNAEGEYYLEDLSVLIPYMGLGPGRMGGV